MNLSAELRSLVIRLSSLLSAVALGCVSIPATAQRISSIEFPRTYEVASLPDSPGAMLSPAAPDMETVSSSSASPSVIEASRPEPESSTGADPVPPASRNRKLILPGQEAPALTAADKARLGFAGAVTPFAAFGWLSAAAYSQALDSSPNYGQGWKPFGQRLGAAAARGTSEDILSDAVFAPLFHEDPRYFILGRSHSLVHRAIYAATRTVITRSDSGSSTVNFSLLAGNAAGSILSNAYYPDANRNAKVTAETFAGSVGGSAIGFLVREFLSDALGAVHLKALE